MILVLVEVELSKSYLTFVILAVEGIMTSTDGRAGKLIFKSNVMSLPAGISRPNAKVVVYARQYFPSFKLLHYFYLCHKCHPGYVKMVLFRRMFTIKKFILKKSDKIYSERNMITPG